MWEITCNFFFHILWIFFSLENIFSGEYDTVVPEMYVIKWVGACFCFRVTQLRQLSNTSWKRKCGTKGNHRERNENFNLFFIAANGGMIKVRLCIREKCQSVPTKTTSCVCKERENLFKLQNDGSVHCWQVADPRTPLFTLKIHVATLLRKWKWKRDVRQFDRIKLSQLCHF